MGVGKAGVIADEANNKSWGDLKPLGGVKSGLGECRRVA